MPSYSSDPLPIDSPERKRLPPLLRKSWYGLNQAFRRRISHLGITPDQFTVLRTLMDGHPDRMTQRELTDFMSSDPNTVASLLERMERSGLLERQPHETDRRANRVVLLEPGKTAYLAAREVAVLLQTEVLHVLPAARRNAFLEELETVAEACRESAEKSPGRHSR